MLKSKRAPKTANFGWLCNWGFWQQKLTELTWGYTYNVHSFCPATQSPVFLLTRVASLLFKQAQQKLKRKMRTWWECPSLTIRPLWWAFPNRREEWLSLHQNKFSSFHRIADVNRTGIFKLFSSHIWPIRAKTVLTLYSFVHQCALPNSGWTSAGHLQCSDTFCSDTFCSVSFSHKTHSFFSSQIHQPKEKLHKNVVTTQNKSW